MDVAPQRQQHRHESRRPAASNPMPARLPAPCSRLAMTTELPGAAYLQRRLARAQAVPPAERSPDVQAFITSVELGERICELQPLTRGGPAALPLRNPATARKQAGFAIAALPAAPTAAKVLATHASC